MIKNPYHREIVRLAVPSIVTNVTVPLLGLADLAIVGHIGNETMIGAIAVGSMVFNVMYWLMGFLRMGTTGMTANVFTSALEGGESLSGRSSLAGMASSSSRPAALERPKTVLRRFLRLALLIALGFVALQVPLRWVALWLMGPTAEVATLVSTYFNICIWGAPAVLSLYVMTGWFIGMQDTRTPMVVSIAQNIVNILLSLLLVFVFKMQIEGVALGTLIAQWSGALMAWRMVNSGRLSPMPLPTRKGSNYSQGVQEKRQSTPLPHREGLGESLEGQGGESSSFFKSNRDLFLRTVCLVSVNLFFTAAGARQGDLMLSVNTLLMTFFTLFSYVMDGFANAGEALTGRYHGQRDVASLRAVDRHLFVWGWLMVALFTAVYALGGRAFLGLLTSEQAVVSAALDYLPWALLIPVSGMAAFVYDGIFVGMMETRGMLISCAVATATFYVLFFVFFPLWGNHALWLALIVYLALRGIVQHFYLVYS
ncbi:MAG: MATE family efflux transporter [Prevotella sp.]|nr:MATE family efflux transporter [Prevotella sp.]